MGHLYLLLTAYEINNESSMKKALAYFDKAFDHYKESIRVYNEGDYSYTAPLLSGLKPLKKGELAPVDMETNFWKSKFGMFSKSFVDELRKNPKYAECFE